MKNLLVLSIAALVLVSTPALAEHHEDEMKKARPEMSKKDMDTNKAKQLKELTKKLELTAEQIPEVEAILSEKMAKNAEIRKEKREKTKVVKDQFSTKMKAVLNAEQQIKFEEMSSDKKDKGSHKGSMKGSGHDHEEHDHDKEHKGSMKGSEK